jgi:hypothetical protein
MGWRNNQSRREKIKKKEKKKELDVENTLNLRLRHS